MIIMQPSIIKPYSLFLILGSIALYGGYNTNIWPSVVYGITCSGEETSLFDCVYRLTDNGGTCGSDASVICQSKIVLFCLCLAIFCSHRDCRFNNSLFKLHKWPSTLGKWSH